MSEEEIRNDSWVNLLTGVGGPKDKSSGFGFVPTYIEYDYTALETLYEQDHISATIVDGLGDLVFSKGYQLELADQIQREAILDKLDEIGVEDKIREAMSYERLHGGSAIFIGTDDAKRFDEPLREEAVRNVLYAHVFDKWELFPARYYTDPQSAKFGQPSHYRVHPTDVGIGQQVGVVVHESRFILFRGERTGKRKRIENQGWGQSVLVRAYTAVKQYGGAMASVLALMADASQGIYKIKGLLEIIRAGQEEQLVKRMRVMERIRSSLNAVLLDADGEDYARVATVLTELGNLIDRFQIQISSAAKMPATEIFGRSAAGLNATGENDMRTWYDKGANVQRKTAKPALERFVRLITRSTMGPTQGVEPAVWAIKFPPLWSPSATEAATISKTKMETAVLAKDAGAATSYQIARSLLSGSEWDADLMLEHEEIEALKQTQLFSGLGSEGANGLPTTPALDEEAVIQDDETQLGEELSATNPRELAAQMTELGIDRCEHGKPNRCPICNIERHREVALGPDGQPAWALKWRAIGERAAQVPPTDQPNEDTAAA